MRTDKDEDAVLRYEVDFTAILMDGETVSGATWTSDSGGITFTDEGLAGNRSTLLIGKTGLLKGTVTTSTGRTLVHRLRFVAVEQ